MKVNLRRLKKNPWIKTSGGVVIVVMATILILGCCMFYTTGSFKTTFKNFVSSIIKSVSLDLARAESNVFGYVDYSQNTAPGGIVVQVMSQRVPVQSYIVHADDVDFERYVQLAKEALDHNGLTQTASSEVDYFLYYNGDIYGDYGNLTDYASNTIAEIDVEGQDSNLITREGYYEVEESEQVVDAMAITQNTSFYSLEQLSDFNFFIKNCYIIDSTVASEKIFNAKEFMKKDLGLTIDESEPQILIYHTHSQESFYDSRPGVVADSIVGVGDVLAQILEEDYGIKVIHDTSTYDLVDGKLERNIAYNVALPSLEKILQYNPSIEVMVDLHRDGVDEGMDPEKGKRVTTIDGKKCAQIMFFNGLSTNKNGPIDYLVNPNQEDNLAFSFQLFMKGKNTYPNLIKPIFLKPYRFNLHLKGRSTLVELGTQYNTVEEAKNSMKYLAELLVGVLTKD